MIDFTGKVAWVAGAARPPGIGRAVAVQLARLGADVACIDMVDDVAAADPSQSFAVTRDALAATAAAVESEGRRAVIGAVDLTDPEAVEASVAETAERLGALDVGCNLSGGTGPVLGNGPVLEVDAAGFRAAVDANLGTVWFGARACAAEMVAQGTAGAIVNLASSAGVVGSAGSGAFSAARAGVIRLTEVLAIELGAHGIRVNAVCPRGIAPGESGNPGLVRGAEEEAGALDEWARRTIPLGRLQSVDETAAVIVFLASDAASFVSGQAITVAGGAQM